MSPTGCPGVLFRIRTRLFPPRPVPAAFSDPDLVLPSGNGLRPPSLAPTALRVPSSAAAAVLTLLPPTRSLPRTPPSLTIAAVCLAAVAAAAAACLASFAFCCRPVPPAPQRTPPLPLQLPLPCCSCCGVPPICVSCVGPPCYCCCSAPPLCGCCGAHPCRCCGAHL